MPKQITHGSRQPLTEDEVKQAVAPLVHGYFRCDHEGGRHVFHTQLDPIMRTGQIRDNYFVCRTDAEAVAFCRWLREAGHEGEIFNVRPIVEELDEHPAAALFPLMDDGQLRELADDIKAHGLRERIRVYKGKVLDGRNRLRACKLAGVTPEFTWVPADESPLDFALSHNLHRRHLTTEQKRAVVTAVLKERPQQSNSQVARKVGVDDKTVKSVRVQLETTSEIPRLDRTEGKDGRTRPAAIPRRKEKPIAVEDAPPDEEKQEEAGGEIKPLGVGVIRAHEAINSLTRIPKGDALRKRGFQIVTDWIRHNP